MAFNKNNYMHKYPASSSSSSRNDNYSGLKLPPISSMDNFLPTRSWNPPPFSASSTSPKESSSTSSLPTPPQPEQWKSPPYNSRNELTRDSLYKSPLLFSSTNMMTEQQPHQQHSPNMQQHHNKPLESSSYFQYTSKAYHLQQQQQQKRDLPSSPSSSLHSYHNATSNKVDHDIDQVVLQCNTLSDNMTQHKDQFINYHHHEHSSTRPLLDDMIGRANEVLNALLRLRKHQIASEQYQCHLLQQQKQAAAAAEHQHLQHQNDLESDAWRSSSNESVTNVNNHARQRKRGKRPQFRGRCHSCNISETPEWRRGPDGARTLCNACGLHYAKLARKQQENRGMSNNLLTTPPHRRFSTGKLTPPADEIIIDRSPTG
ncbi:GATA-type zinc finger transcription factor [Mucor lusitanicus]|uniref:GATA-type zinc finger transcription factor n=2 Tax=Mucor circinelloides f. lusitanicus TaxID=29924 RepID=A0A162QQN2_MUCCL|nr:GATA-type zinc finger transcription factor [Mucor lusitanicus]OAD04930.1 GATA-type zinc finger transcription factor [Mucor lusitanicus CBS 277.49]